MRERTASNVSATKIDALVLFPNTTFALEIGDKERTRCDQNPTIAQKDKNAYTKQHYF